MRRIIKQILALAVLILFFWLPAAADTVSDLKKQIEDKNQEIQKLEEEIKQYQENIDEAEETAKTLSGAIKKLDQDIKRLNTNITLTQRKMSKKELEIKELDLGISGAKLNIANRQSAMGESLREFNAVETASPIETFFKYSTLSEFFGELEKIKALSSLIQKNYEELKLLKSDLESRKLSAEKARSDLKSLKSELLDQKEIQEDGKKAKGDLLKATKNQEALYQKLLKDREKKRLEIYNEIRAIETELKKRIDLSTLPSFGRGILLNPIDEGAITQPFGQTSFSKYTDVYANGFHNGIDIRAPIGTSIRAAEFGVVKATGNTDLICPKGSYGKWILIEHPNKLATLYAHLSLIKVGVGQSITRGEVMGSGGNTGYTTGPHLHFTVYDARTVELRKSRVCGTLPYGGYLDPMNYL